ncbi:MAG: hypothetical protein WCJ64_26260, partial [Rhodospirillaceae bacterium]
GAAVEKTDGNGAGAAVEKTDGMGTGAAVEKTDGTNDVGSHNNSNAEHVVPETLNLEAEIRLCQADVSSISDNDENSKAKALSVLTRVYFITRSAKSNPEIAERIRGMTKVKKTSYNHDDFSLLTAGAIYPGRPKDTPKESRGDRRDRRSELAKANDFLLRSIDADASKADVMAFVLKHGGVSGCAKLQRKLKLDDAKSTSTDTVTKQKAVELEDDSSQVTFSPGQHKALLSTLAKAHLSGANTCEVKFRIADDGSVELVPATVPLPLTP